MCVCVSFTHPTGLNCVRCTALLVPARSIRLKDEDLTWDLNDKQLFKNVNPDAIKSDKYKALDELLKQESLKKSSILEEIRRRQERSRKYKTANKSIYRAITATQTIADTFALVTARSFSLTDLCRSGALDVFFVRL
eukprot:GHVU01008771.1.p1 GENE.GHVU01008771.1~~GHVU01008771.1.p1  ORF type:complete len:137 (-),score=6.64 GHVU01008771.1:54-464(-)